MDKLITEFPAQLLEAIEIGSNIKLTVDASKIQNIVVTGLGGSGIGGDLVLDLVGDELKIPFSVNKRYSLPNYVSENTLIIVSSYSGNTEETLQAFSEALEKKLQIVAIASGGKIEQICKENNIDFIKVPAGKSSPRGCLGYSFVQQLSILHQLNFISNSFLNECKASAAFLEKEMTSIKQEAKALAKEIQNKIPIIYSEDRIESVAIRWRQQINENSKQLCWHHVVPEMNHNELVGWRTKNDDLAVIYLRNKTDYSRNQTRIQINKEIIENYTNHIFEVWSKGDSDIQRALYLIHFGDWVSYYGSEFRNFDAVEIKVINYLKEKLAQS